MPANTSVCWHPSLNLDEQSTIKLKKNADDAEHLSWVEGTTQQCCFQPKNTPNAIVVQTGLPLSSAVHQNTPTASAAQLQQEAENEIPWLQSYFFLKQP